MGLHRQCPAIGDITQTSLDFTGQKRDGTGLLFYNARYYDPGIAKFVSPDTIVPGMAAGMGGGAATVGLDGVTALAPLTVGFHEPGFVAGLNAEQTFTQGRGFFNKDSTPRTGPANPQTLNRYAYVLNNAVRYTDANGHYRLEALSMRVGPTVHVTLILHDIDGKIFKFDGGVYDFHSRSRVNGAACLAIKCYVSGEHDEIESESYRNYAAGALASQALVDNDLSAKDTGILDRFADFRDRPQAAGGLDYNPYSEALTSNSYASSALDYVYGGHPEALDYRVLPAPGWSCALRLVAIQQDYDT